MTDNTDTSQTGKLDLHLTPAQMAWLSPTPVQKVFDVLQDAGFGARAVGGAVRNTLLGTPVADIDIATTATPEKVVSLAKAAGLAAHETGLSHGTITIVSDHLPFEVTTLRRDVESLGRHAVVAYTTDWCEDARRRDFTINALYCDRHGQVFDPLGGYKDLVARRVKFIGDAQARIKEDYLRILRFFRFSATYTEGRLDKTGLDACLDLRAGLEELSRERVGAELQRLLEAPYCVDVLAKMAAHDLLQPLVSGPVDVARLTRLIATDTATPGDPSDAMLRLSALCLRGEGDAARLARALRLSSAQKQRLAVSVTNNGGTLSSSLEEKDAKALLFHLGLPGYRDRVRLAWADDTKDTANAMWANLLQLPDRWSPPELPANGADVMALGVPAGPGVGTVLRQFEDWWVAAGFPDDKEAIAAQLAALARLTHS